MKLYKILSASRESVHGGSYRYPGKGRWTRRVEVALCRTGYHLARAQDLAQWVKVGCMVWEAEGEGDGVWDEDKVVFHRVRLLRKVGQLTDFVLRLWAADCAERVVHLTGADQRCLDAIEAARRYARGEIGVDELDAASAASAAAASIAARNAWDAAWASSISASNGARDAARDAAWAARDASDDAARDAARAASAAAASIAAQNAWDAAWASSISASNGARDAANDAAWAASWAASKAARAASKAARDVAWDAERKWQGQRLLEILEAEGGAV